jgi:hypothetical protein
MRFFYSDIFFYIWYIPKIKITHVTTYQCFNYRIHHCLGADQYPKLYGISNHRSNSIIFLKRKIGLRLVDNTKINYYR